jgi:hypothetical protein
VGKVLTKPCFKNGKTESMRGKADPVLQFEILTDELLPRFQAAQDGKRRVFNVDVPICIRSFSWDDLLSLPRVYRNRKQAIKLECSRGCGDSES